MVGVENGWFWGVLGGGGTRKFRGDFSRFLVFFSGVGGGGVGLWWWVVRNYS